VRSLGNPHSAAGLARIALQHGLITDETAQAVQGLTVLRNLTAHGRENDLTVERALDYQRWSMPSCSRSRGVPRV
jgi:uncharacterized protein YutE (UPF0331/DUF86 family)